MSHAFLRGDIFNYTDYRAFLADFYKEAKKTKSISLRAFSKKAGFTSPNYLKMVMDGDRNLTEESITRFVSALELNKQEEEFFRNLVLFNQAKSHAKKNLYYQNLLRCRKFSQFKPIEKDQYVFYSAWYHPVVRELVTMQGAGRLSPEEMDIINQQQVGLTVTPTKIRHCAPGD